MTDKLLFNTKEACQKLGLGTNRAILDSLRRGGLIKTIKLGRNYMYPSFELERFVKDNVGHEITADCIVFEEV